MFEYKVRAKHKLGYKEFNFYANTNIEEFLNRNSIDYVRNMTDTIENRLYQENEKLHSIIKEAREYIENYNKVIRENKMLGEYASFMIIPKELKEILEKGEENK